MNYNKIKNCYYICTLIKLISELETVPEGGSNPLQLLSLWVADANFSASNTTLLIIAILILLLLTAIVAGAETAFFSLKAKDVNYLKTKEEPNARLVAKLLDHPQQLLATILVTNSFVNIAIIIATNVLVRQLLPSNLSGIFSFLIQVVIVTFLLVLFGEVLPKVYATQNNIRMALFSAPAINLMVQLCRPITHVLVKSTNYIEQKLVAQNTNNISNEDFEHAIELTVGHTATKEEVNIFKGILKFGNITSRQIMRTRMDVSALPITYNFTEVQKFVIEVGYSRMPVYKENLDQIEGILYTKDLLPYIDTKDFNWQSIIRPAYFVHEGKYVEDLLREFQQKRIHFAVVVDEFGGTSGIITLEDIMEEIIGEIKDEFDEDDLHFKKIDDNNYILEGKTLINDVCKLASLPTETFDEVRYESDSLAGLILEIHGNFPKINEVVSYKNYDFTVLEIEKMRIKKVQLTIVSAIPTAGV